MREFYELNPKLIERYEPYMIAYRKNQQDEISDVGWTNGLYVGRAISASFPKGKTYPNEPLRLYSTANPEDSEEGKPISDADRFGGFATVFNKRFAGTRGAKDPAQTDGADAKNVEAETLPLTAETNQDANDISW